MRSRPGGLGVLREIGWWDWCGLRVRGGHNKNGVSLAAPGPQSSELAIFPKILPANLHSLRFHL